MDYCSLCKDLNHMADGAYHLFCRSNFCWLIFAFFIILAHQACAIRMENATYLHSTANVSSQIPVKEEYVVFSGNTTQQSQQLIASLRSILASGDIAEYGGPYTGPQFWLVQMNSAQIYRLLKSIPGVSTARSWYEQCFHCPTMCPPDIFPSELR